MPWDKVQEVCSLKVQIKLESRSSFCKKSLHVLRFTGPLQTCFAVSDSPMYGVTPTQFHPIRGHYSRKLQQPDLFFLIRN